MILRTDLPRLSQVDPSVRAVMALPDMQLYKRMILRETTCMQHGQRGNDGPTLRIAGAPRAHTQFPCDFLLDGKPISAYLIGERIELSARHSAEVHKVKGVDRRLV